MRQFKRVVRVTGGPAGGTGATVSENRIVFKVRKTNGPKHNEIDVQIYNVAKETRAKFESTDSIITVQAGYEDDVIGVVGTGDVSRYNTEYQPPNVILRVQCGDGLRSLRDSRVTLAYSGSVSARRVIEEIARQMSLRIRQTDADLSGAYRQGFAFSGKARQALDSVTARFGLTWSIQNFELQILNARTPTNREAVVLTPDTGLLASPERLDDISDQLSDEERTPGYMVRSLLNPRIEPEQRIIVESRDIPRAQFRVINVEHVGDNRGKAWYSKTEIVEL